MYSQINVQYMYSRLPCLNFSDFATFKATFKAIRHKRQFASSDLQFVFNLLFHFFFGDSMAPSDGVKA